jgi:putative aldouronate transport system permease protein
VRTRGAESLLLAEDTTKRAGILRRIFRDYQFYLMVLPGLAITLVFRYVPIYGIIMAFQDFSPAKGYLGSRFVGLKHIASFIHDPYFFRSIKNTVVLGVSSLTFGFPAAIILALLFNEVTSPGLKRVYQTISYVPYFLSTVIVVGLMMEMTGVEEGIVNQVLVAIGVKRIQFFAEPGWFVPLYITSGIWQGVGFGSIIYLAAISGINPDLYEAARIDGAGRFNQIRFVTLPGMAPTIVIMLIFAVGGILGNDFQKILLMYNQSTYETADVVQTYVYRAGILGASYSYTTAIGLFMSLISFLFLFVTNLIARRLSETALW